MAWPHQPWAHRGRLRDVSVAVPQPWEGALRLEEDAVAGLQFHAIFACLSGQLQPVLRAACACLKVFGFDNPISARPFLAPLSTC